MIKQICNKVINKIMIKRIVFILKKNINKWKYLTEKYEYPRYEMDILLQKAY